MPDSARLRRVGVTLGVAAFVVGLFVTPTPSPAMRRTPSEAMVCELSSLIVAGTVTRTETYLASDVMTNVTLAVERVVHGDPPSPMVFRVLGGRLDGVTHAYPDRPSASVGDRLLMFFHVLPATDSDARAEGAANSVPPRVITGPVTAERMRMVESIQLKPTTVLPSEAELRAIWREHCLPAAAEGPRPTQQYLAFLSSDLLSRCEHY